MGRTKPIITLGIQDFVVLGLIGDKKTIAEIKETLTDIGKSRVEECRQKLLEVGLIEQKERGVYKITKDGKWFLNFNKRREELNG